MRTMDDLRLYLGYVADDSIMRKERYHIMTITAENDETIDTPSALHRTRLI